MSTYHTCTHVINLTVFFFFFFFFFSLNPVMKTWHVEQTYIPATTDKVTVQRLPCTKVSKHSLPSQQVRLLAGFWVRIWRVGSLPPPFFGWMHSPTPDRHWEDTCFIFSAWSTDSGGQRLCYSTSRVVGLVRREGWEGGLEGEKRKKTTNCQLTAFLEVAFTFPLHSFFSWVYCVCSQ